MGTATATATATARLEREWQRARRRIRLANYVDKRPPGAAAGASGEPAAPTAAFREQLARATRAVVRRARRRRLAKRATEVETDLSDARLAELAPLTDHLALQDYGNGLLNTCPRLVNVVSERPRPCRTPTPRAQAAHPRARARRLRSSRRPSRSPARASRSRSTCTPSPRGALTPTSRRSGSAPSSWPTTCRGRGSSSSVRRPDHKPASCASSRRARLLCADTGRLVQTGCSGPMEARLSVMRAVRQLQLEAGIHVRVRAFSVINQVGAASLHARLDCDRFATEHSSSAHYDRQARTPSALACAFPCALPAHAPRAVLCRLGVAAAGGGVLLRDLRDWKE